MAVCWVGRRQSGDMVSQGAVIRIFAAYLHRRVGSGFGRARAAVWCSCLHWSSGAKAQTANHKPHLPQHQRSRCCLLTLLTEQRAAVISPCFSAAAARRELMALQVSRAEWHQGDEFSTADASRAGRVTAATKALSLLRQLVEMGEL